MAKCKSFFYLPIIIFLSILSFFCLCSQNKKVYASGTIFSDNNTTHEAEGEQSLSDLIEQLLSGLNLSDLQKLFDDYGNIFLGGQTLQEIINTSLNGSQTFDFFSMFSEILKIFMKNINHCFAFIATIVSIAFLSGLATSFETGKTKLNDVVFLVSYGTISVLIFSECASSFDQIKSVITNISKQSESIFPLLLTLVLICGGKSSSTVIKPVCVFLNNGILQIVLKILFPILSAACVILLVSCLNEKFGLKGLFNLALDCFKWIVGITVVVFAFFVTINGLGASVFDGVSLRALKYAIGSSIPIIGNFAKEGVDLVIASGILIKNSIGGISIILIFSALFSPFVTIFAFSLTLKILVALIQPFADARICNLVASFSKIITLLCVLLIMVFIVYFVTIFIIICAQNQVMVT